MTIDFEKRLKIVNIEFKPKLEPECEICETLFNLTLRIIKVFLN